MVSICRNGAWNRPARPCHNGRAPLLVFAGAGRLPLEFSISFCNGTMVAKMRLLGAAVVAMLAAACASQGKLVAAEANPALVAAVRAEVRMVGSETTWVAPGPGYDL